MTVGRRHSRSPRPPCAFLPWGHLEWNLQCWCIHALQCIAMRACKLISLSSSQDSACHYVQHPAPDCSAPAKVPSSTRMRPADVAARTPALAAAARRRQRLARRSEDASARACASRAARATGVTSRCGEVHRSALNAGKRGRATVYEAPAALLAPCARRPRRRRRDRRFRGAAHSLCFSRAEPRSSCKPAAYPCCICKCVAVARSSAPS